MISQLLSLTYVFRKEYFFLLEHAGSYEILRQTVWKDYVVKG